MEKANKSTPATNKATMGNNTSTTGNDNKNQANSTATTATTTSSNDMKAKSNNNKLDSLSKNQPTQEQQKDAKNEIKADSKTSTVTEESKTHKSEINPANSKAQSSTETTSTTNTTTTATSTAAPQTSTVTIKSVCNDIKNLSLSNAPSISKVDIPPPPAAAAAAAEPEDKLAAKQQQESSSKDQTPSDADGSNPAPVLSEFPKSTEPNLQQYNQRHNKTMNNNFHQQHHQNSQDQQHQQPTLHQQNNSNQYHSHFQPHHHQHQSNDEQLSKTNLYIRGLNADTSDSDLYTLCNRFGSIVSTKAILDKSTNKCKGYGFVDFDNPASAEMAVTELQKQGILVHMAKQQEADPTNLYIANLPQTMTESDLETLLQPYGQVVSTRILINQNRQPRGVGFARMETKEQCDSIIALLNGQVIKGSKEPLLVKFADGANKKRPHHFQHKPLGSNLFMGNHMRRNNGNDTNHYHMMNSGPGSNRNFHGGSFSEHSRQNHTLTHHDNGLIKHQQMLTTMPGYHSHHQSGGHPPYMIQQSSMMGPTSAIDPSVHYVNLANQMPGLPMGNHPGGYMTPQQWPPVWPHSGSSAFSSNSNTSRDTILR